MVKKFYPVLAAALAALLLVSCPKPTVSTHPPAVYSITYDGNGATSGTVPIDNREYREGETLTVKGNTGNLAQDNKDFLGWAKEQGAAEPQYNEGDELTISESLTLYAVWRGKPYTMNFDKNHAGAGGSQASLADQIWRDPIPLPTATIFTPPAGMSFAGWAETPTGAVIRGAYTGPASYSADVILYAVWGTGNKDWLSIASSSDGRYLAAGVDGGGIFTSVDFGATWRRSAADNRTWRSIASSGDGKKLAAVVDGGSIYTSVDFGATWRRSAADNRTWRSIASSSDGKKLAAVVDGGSIYTSANFGATWTPRATGMSRDWRSIASSSDGRYLAAGVDGGGIYTSGDFGAAWTNRSAVGDAQSNPIFESKNWRSIASSSDGSKLAAVVGNGSIYTSGDFGATWTNRSAAGDAQSNPIFESKSWRSIASSSDGSKLAAVVENGSIYTSDDFGATWRNSSR